MPDEMLKKLLECGVHFGHQTRRWNPKMKRFIFGERSGIYIIDLEKTKEYLNSACEYVRQVAATGGAILFVGTKKQAKDVVADEAKRAQMPYVNNRWMGGLLTNFQTIRKSVEKLEKIEKLITGGGIENFKKKEAVQINTQKDKLLRDLQGIRDMRKLPQAVFIIDSKKEAIAVQEAKRLGIPIVGLIDTNCDPDFINYPIPGNDDALKSVKFIMSTVADAMIAGRKEFAETEAVRQKTAKEKEEAFAKNKNVAVDDSQEGQAEPREVTSASAKPVDESKSE
ncbi:MAG: 30S ribosomal protein S2 [Candidatus Omnitrophica bacterium]|nr:30S ribosomal protein S2 [Candidatus Omnitrophota bacterium]